MKHIYGSSTKKKTRQAQKTTKTTKLHNSANVPCSFHGNKMINSTIYNKNSWKTRLAHFSYPVYLNFPRRNFCVLDVDVLLAPINLSPSANVQSGFSSIFQRMPCLFYLPAVIFRSPSFFPSVRVLRACVIMRRVSPDFRKDPHAFPRAALQLRWWLSSSCSAHFFLFLGACFFLDSDGNKSSANSSKIKTEKIILKISSKIKSI